MLNFPLKRRRIDAHHPLRAPGRNHVRSRDLHPRDPCWDLRSLLRSRLGRIPDRDRYQGEKLSLQQPCLNTLVSGHASFLPLNCFDFFQSANKTGVRPGGSFYPSPYNALGRFFGKIICGKR